MSSTDQATNVNFQLTPYVCMMCGDAKGSPYGWLTPLCQNHGLSQVFMTPFPINDLRSIISTRIANGSKSSPDDS
jgi:hypothetical protein